MRTRRATLHDVFKRGEESVVMAGSNVVRLSPLATYLIEQMADWRTREELAVALIDRFGSPPEGSATDFLESTLTELARLEIVEVEP